MKELLGNMMIYEKNPDDREDLYDNYKKALVKAGKRYIEVNGTTEERLVRIKKSLKRMRLLPKEVSA